MACGITLYVSANWEICKYTDKFYKKRMGSGAAQFEADGFSAADRCMHCRVLFVFPSENSAFGSAYIWLRTSCVLAGAYFSKGI